MNNFNYQQYINQFSYFHYDDYWGIKENNKQLFPQPGFTILRRPQIIIPQSPQQSPSGPFYHNVGPNNISPHSQHSSQVFSPQSPPPPPPPLNYQCFSPQSPPTKYQCFSHQVPPSHQPFSPQSNCQPFLPIDNNAISYNKYELFSHTEKIQQFLQPLQSLQPLQPSVLKENNLEKEQTFFNFGDCNDGELGELEKENKIKRKHNKRKYFKYSVKKH